MIEHLLVRIHTRVRPTKSLLFLFADCEADCQNKSQQMKNCIILLASNNVLNKNAFVTQQLSALLPQTFAWDSFGASNKKSGAFRKTGSQPSLLSPLLKKQHPLPPFPARSPSSSMFLQAASYASSPVAAAHYKYDEQLASL